MDAERQRIINEAARIVNEIDQMFIDARTWNELHPNEPMVADPDGRLAAVRRYAESVLQSEALLGHFPSVVPLKARRRNYIPVVGD